MSGRIRTSLERHAAPSATAPEQVRDLADMVFREGRGVMFFPEDLEQMPWQSRELILAEAKRVRKKGGR